MSLPVIDAESLMLMVALLALGTTDNTVPGASARY
jgi:hypothetical protein